jgi:hypothetical protein
MTSSAPCPWAGSRLPQLLAQITGYLDQALAVGRLGHDLGQHPAHAIDAAVIFLENAHLLQYSAEIYVGVIHVAKGSCMLWWSAGSRLGLDGIRVELL